MAQKTENEETEFKVVVTEKTISHCINNCGFTGSPATKNMCQKCFTFSSDKSVRSISSTSPRRPNFPTDQLISVEIPADQMATVGSEVSIEKPSTMMLIKEVNRCSGCRKRVGLTGFRCRCGDLFCSDHRYSDRHECSYDYKSAGREAIARENPIVKAAKIVRV